MSKFRAGISFRSMGVLLLLLLLSAMLKQFTEVILKLPATMEHTLPLPVLWAFLAYLLVTGVLWRVFRVRILSQAELLCVFFALLMAAPIMTQGFWHRVLSISATIPRTADASKYDSMSDRLWPHGPNLLRAALRPGAQLSAARGLRWEQREVGKGQLEDVAVLTGGAEGGFVRFALPADSVPENMPHLFALLVQTKQFVGDAYVYGRLYESTEATDRFTELFRTASVTKTSPLFPSGFARQVAYGVRATGAGTGGRILEIGISGTGEVALADPVLMDVSTLDQAYTGRRIVAETDLSSLSVADQAGVVVRPTRMLSLAGLRFLLSGYVPWRDWWVPLAAWTSLILLVLMATFALGVLLRRQWIDNERFPLPVTHAIHALLGREGEPSIWRNRMMWAGFCVSLAWCLLRGWSFYNPNVPNLNIEIPLLPYFAESQTAPMWRGVTFAVSAIFLSLATFMELGVLASIVTGFFLFRALFWIGDITGMASNAGYPFTSHQKVAAFLMYALLTLFFTRKYWGRVFRAIRKNDQACWEGEALSYRAAMLLLVGCFGAAALWARWVGAGIGGILVFFTFVVLVGLVSARIRAECGTPYGYFAPDNGILLLSLLGGIPVFGAPAMVVILMASFLFMVSSFFLNPGAQVELLQLGREARVVPRHLFYAMVAGVVGGILIGGWVFLSNAYAIGGNNIKYAWAFDTKPWALFAFNQELARVGASAATETVGIRPETWAWAYAGGGTLVLAVLRQLFAGFWFHPVGFILGSSHFTDGIWGSCLAAWVIRFSVLKIGGASTVREKLRPFFIGFLVAAALSPLIFSIHAGWLATAGIENVYRAIP